MTKWNDFSIIKPAYEDLVLIAQDHFGDGYGEYFCGTLSSIDDMWIIHLNILNRSRSADPLDDYDSHLRVLMPIGPRDKWTFFYGADTDET